MQEPGRHVPLLPDPWDPEVAQASIREFVGDALARFDARRFWPAHPLDDGARDGATALYFGAAGVIWAIDRLRRTGLAESGTDFTPVLSRLIAANQTIDRRRSPYPAHASLLMGDVGVLLLALRLTSDPSIADALFGRVGANSELPSLELMWGAPGSMLASVFASGMTGEPRWRSVFRVQAAQLLAELEDTPVGPLWTQHLYGHANRYLGMVHGFAGNMTALLAGWDWLDPAQRALIAAAIPRTLRTNAWEFDAGVNWRAVAGGGSQPILVQICHGAPGIVVAFAGAPFEDPGLGPLLCRAGELVWHAGPLAKGPGLCHGTSGNGYAFLKLYARTRDPLWLERARAFAMTAVAQARVARTRYGRGRYSLWTGDLGVAVYLADCLAGEARFPTLDVF